MNYATFNQPSLISEITTSLSEHDIQETSSLLSLSGSNLTFVKQQSRRYLGCKYKLVGFIKQILDLRCGSWRTFCDIFAGTGVVGAAVNSPEVKIKSNDLLRCNYVCLQTFLGMQNKVCDQLEQHLIHLNSLKCKKSDENYFSQHFGGTYFSQENAVKIGVIREEIDSIANDDNEKVFLLCSLLYAVDKVANTVGHYDAYRKSLDLQNLINLQIPLIDPKKNQGNRVYCEDANNLIRKIECDVLYIDPPYNSRQYSDAYHVLENLVEWKKPDVYGKAKKMDRSHIKSLYCVNGARDSLADLVEQANCGHILLSYNNTGSSLDNRSNARITQEEIIQILSAKGKVEVFETQHRAFTTGNGKSDNNVEQVFYCRVKNR